MRGPGTPALIRVTPFPNALLDTAMITLKDTEWRVLCVVVRQTLGWEDFSQGLKRKRADWISRSQLKLKTHRHSAALSNAVDGLVRRGLIEVRDGAGKPLATRQARRRHGDKLFYCLSEKLLATLQPQQLNREATYQQGCLKSELRKANTTKETDTKFIYENHKRSCPQLVDNKQNWRTKHSKNKFLRDDNETVPRTYRGGWTRVNPRIGFVLTSTSQDKAITLNTPE